MIVQLNISVQAVSSYDIFQWLRTQSWCSLLRISEWFQIFPSLVFPLPLAHLRSNANVKLAVWHQYTGDHCDSCLPYCPLTQYPPWYWSFFVSQPFILSRLNNFLSNVPQPLPPPSLFCYYTILTSVNSSPMKLPKTNLIHSSVCISSVHLVSAQPGTWLTCWLASSLSSSSLNQSFPFTFIYPLRSEYFTDKSSIKYF